jgi:glycine/D-amino acid oxidase-like deaminating enzyme/nitrite reductase/ring-hydroxylating ferredoxin subunit
MNTISLWRDIQKKSPSYTKLDRNAEVDVVIVGAGITGIIAALQLIQAGKSVALLEALKVGGGTTGDSTGNLYVAVQPYYHKIEAKFDAETVKTIAHSRQFSMDFIEALVKEKNIDCFFHRRPWYLYSKETKTDKIVEREVATLKEAKMEIDFVDSIPLPFKITRAAKMERQARFNPLKFITALAEDLSRNGCAIFEETRFLDFEEKKGRCLVQTDRGRIKARDVIMATHVPKGINFLQTLAIPYRSYAVAVRLKGGEYPNANFWDTSEPHHATSTHSTTSAGLDLLVVADSHHKTGQVAGKNHVEMYRQIEDHLHRHYDVGSVAYRWSAQHYQAADGVPYIGRVGRSSRHTYVATGYFADGLAYGVIAGILLTDLILGKKNPWAKVYDSTRFTPLASVKKFMKEGVNVLAQYLKDLPKNVDAKNFADIAPGEGKTVAIKGEKLAAYRDADRTLHVVSAVCTHMQCIVKFNDAEKSWDCPCHGSRFTVDGQVIEGPAIIDLEQRNVR